MPVLAEPARPTGFLRDLDQPHIEVDDRIALRPWHSGDAATVRTAFDDPDIQRWHARRIDDLDEARAWIANWTTRWAGEVDASWAIIRTDGLFASENAKLRKHQIIGQVGLRGISLFEGSAHLSYWVLPEARGAGVAVRAARALTRWSFDVVGLHRMSLEHSTRNAASCRVATKLGFEVEGTSRGSALHADGWHDMHVHARLRTDD